MNIENEIFQGYTLNESFLIPYGFIKEDDIYIKEYQILNTFTVFIYINKDKVDGKIFDNETSDEYVLFRLDKTNGEFVGQIREAYKEILYELRDNCFSRAAITDQQALRVIDYIYRTYHDEPEYKWIEKYPTYAVFRNKDNKKWYLIIMEVEDNKLGDNISKRYIMNIHPPMEMYHELLKLDNIFPGWHMNKKRWLSVSLSDYLDDDTIFSLIDLSYSEISLQNSH